MNFLNKEKDNILSILKSLRPIKYLYSKQNRDYDKFFRSSSVKGLIKQMNSKPRFDEYLKPGESLESFNNNKNQNILNVNFKSTFNYIEELSNLRNLPIVLLNKRLFKNGRFNSDFEDNLVTKNEKNKQKEEEKKRKYKKISHKNSGDSDVTLDPGRYHPNYNYIKRRYPCAYLGKPKMKEEESSQRENRPLEKEEKKEKEKESEKEKDNENEKSMNENSLSHNDNENSSNHKTEKKSKKDYSPSSTNINPNNKNKNKMNFSSPNFFSNSKLATMKEKEKKKFKLSSKNKNKRNNMKLKSNAKDHNTISSLSNEMDLKKSANLKVKLLSKNSEKFKTNVNFYNSHRLKNITNYPKNYHTAFKFNKNNSAEGVKCQVNFDKMPGRDRPINFVDSSWEGCRTNYNPDYKIIRPHIPSFIFQSRRKYDTFKKFITGKIIRSYCYSPDNYFVFNIKDNKDDKIPGEYGTFLMKANNKL